MTLPPGWTAVTLGEICEFKYGKGLTGGARHGAGFPVYGSNGVVGENDAPLTAGPTVIVGRKGSFGEVHYSPTACWPIDTTYFVDDGATACDLRWLSYRLQGLGLKGLNKSAAIPGLNREDAYRQRLLLPPVADQRRIAEVLDRANALRVKRHQALSLHEDLKSALFHDMFGDPGRNPKRWPLVALVDLACKFSDGPFGSNLKSSHYRTDGIRVIRLQNIGIGRFMSGDAAFISLDHFATLVKHECLPGDVLIGTLGDPNLRACVQPESLPRALNKADCVQARPDPAAATSEYLCWLVNSPGTLAMAQSLMLGQTRVRISMGRLRGLKVPQPPLELQKTFSRRIKAIQAHEELMFSRDAEGGALLASLQQRAFAGQL